MSKTVAIVQSNYIPWKGYFDLINMVDEFILFDDMQYTKRDWRNRNKIKIHGGSRWLTIPVQVKGKYVQKIKDTLISEMSWGIKHWKTISLYYGKTTYFNEYSDLFEDLYMDKNNIYLSEINFKFIKIICGILGINTKLTWSMDYHLNGIKTECLVDLCQQAGATHYISGPMAKNYLDESLFEKKNIDLTYIDYSGYPVYNQLHPPFDHHVTILDLIFNEGLNSVKYMKSF